MLTVGIWTGSSLWSAGLAQLVSNTAGYAISWVEQTKSVPEKTAEELDILVVAIGAVSPVVLARIDCLVKRSEKRPKIVVIFNTKLGIEETGEFVKRGVLGFLHYETSPSDLSACLGAVAQGVYYLDPAATSWNLVHTIEMQIRRRRKKGTFLSKREEQVLKMLATGYTTRQIAGQLFISLKTVDAHKYNLMRKLFLHNRVELTRYAMSHGYVEIPAPAVVFQ